MKYLHPLILLKKELKLHIRSLQKSNESYDNGEIDKELNDLYRKNLTKIITQFNNAIEKLS